MRDLTEETDEVVAAERSRIASEGWGARLLELQSPGGHWGGDDDDGGWMTTIYTLVLLKDLGVDPTGQQARRAIGLVRDRITWWQLDGRPFFDGETEPCINGAILAAAAYFGEASDRWVDRLLDEQLEDGGWNCQAPPSKRLYTEDWKNYVREKYGAPPSVTYFESPVVVDNLTHEIVSDS